MTQFGLRRGFTLLELTLVVTIVGVLVALGLPRVALLRDRSSVHGAAGELAALFSTARQTAMARRAAVAIVIDTAAGTIELRAVGMSPQRRPLRAIYGVAVGANRDSAVYDPRGLGYGLSNLSVTIRRGAIVDTLTMSRLGRVKW